MYIIFFTIAYLINFYCQGSNYTYFQFRFLLEACLFSTLYWSFIIFFMKKRNKQRFLFILFLVHIIFLFIIPFCQFTRIYCIPNLKECLILYQYRWYIVFFLATFFIIISYKIISIIHLNKFIRILNVFSGTLLIVSIIKVFYIVINYNLSCKIDNVKTNNQFPNIYHICLDSYVSYEYLKKAYHYDNREFYNHLQKLGFWYDLKAKSNYTSTIPSFCSAFQLDYLKTKEYNESDLIKKIRKNNKALNILAEKGYRRLLFSPSVPTLESKSFSNVLPKTRFNFYYYLFLFTPVEHFLHKAYLKHHFLDILNQIKDIENVKKLYGEKNNYFLFHIINPHEPFIFSDKDYPTINTEETSNTAAMFIKQDDLAKRTNKMLIQIRTLNSLILKSITSVLNSYNEDNKPIIILHGDHGMSLQQTINLKAWEFNKINDMDKAIFGILYAVYLPENLKNTAPIPNGLVNLYRWLNNLLFHSNYNYLDSKQIMRIDNKFFEYKF